MITEYRCTCGYRGAVEPAALRSGHVCGHCRNPLRFVTADDAGTNIYWILVGPRDATPTVAIPLIDGTPLGVGSDESNWLRIQGDGVEPQNTELRADRDRRIRVRHVGEEGRTWIDRAAVLEGVLNFENELRVGEYVIHLTTTATLKRIAAADAAPVVIEGDADGAGDENGGYYEEEERAPRSRQRGSYFEDWSTSQKVRALASVAIVVVAGIVTGRMVFFPAVSDEMPSDTYYACPIDGTKFRASWSDGPPTCPQCHQLILGAIDYDAEPTIPAPPAMTPPSTLPAPATSDSANPSASSGKEEP